MRLDKLSISPLASLLIIACQFKLALTLLLFTFGKGIRILGKKGLFLKSPDIIEKMNDVTDKYSIKLEQLLSQIEIENDESELQNINWFLKHSSNSITESIGKNIFSNSIPILEFHKIKGNGIRVRIGNDFYRIGSSSWILDKEKANFSEVWVQKMKNLLVRSK